MGEATTNPDPSHLLSRLEDILESDPIIDEVGFIHPNQFTAFTEEVCSKSSSASGTKLQLEDGSYDNFFCHHGHKLGISIFVLVPLYRVAKDAFMDAYDQYVISCESRAKTVDELDGNALFLDIVEKEVMKHSKALLLLSSDFGTAWNSRKVIVSKKLLLPMFMDELLLSALVLSYSPKSERAWSHRRWVIKMITGKCTNLQEILDRESQLVETLAENSKMNYRAWNHRCWLVSYMSNSQVLLELTSSRAWAGLHVADNSCFSYRARLLLHMIESLQQNKDSDGLSGAELHKTLKDELDWIGMLIRRYLGREALWLHRRFLSLVWVKQHLAPDYDHSNMFSNSPCASCNISVFVKDELILLNSCLNFPNEEDDFGDYAAQATHAATYVLWLAKQLPMSFGVELQKSSEYEGWLRPLLDDIGKSCLWESFAAIR
ncbi:Protein prenylyltransferase superfamily protein [Striga hermonthica]|uniref:Protein prenylyltransferase superfamily protein n=1 Tax=Striga hermonthica TaxID=68872 RepID=A0A9N7RCP7_STRHE|nr:Protein prenylyltransferase superfamily protein [Striga hermonthica]